MHIQSIPMCRLMLRSRHIYYQATVAILEYCRNICLFYVNSIGTGKGNNYAYLVTDEPTKQSVIIDPANPPE